MSTRPTRRSHRIAAAAILVLATMSSVALASQASAHTPAPGVGLVDPAQGYWHLRYPDGTEDGFFYGNPGDLPFMGDWDCDGIDTPGLYRQSDGYAYLRNSNSVGTADIRFFFGDPGDFPIPGDFDGDGCDTLSIYRESEARFYIINELGANEGGLGDADFWFAFGDAGDTPFAGDFDGDGKDEVGLHRAATGLVYFESELVKDGWGGAADHAFVFGNGGDRFLAGDWGTPDGVETPALFRPGDTTFYFRHANQGGAADASLVFGEASWLPVGGVFASPTTTTTTTTAPDAYPILRPGDEGPAVVTAQELLTEAGYYDGPLDGVYGPGTEAAVAAYQEANGLTVDGKVGPDTWSQLLGLLECPPSTLVGEHVVAGLFDGDPDPGWRGEPCIEQWHPLVEKWFEVPEVDTALGVMRCESWGDRDAVNPYSGTGGLFQHRPELWDARYSATVAFWADRGKTVPAGGDRFDPEINIAAAAYLVYADGWWHWGTFNGNYGCYDWVVHALENPL
ncbi:MAG TPA: peptidoglycan-binding protein [Acidimicrobiia bacterium]|nr:peptidoglycan-binding protein [Acidimicrobiia bacterium]